MIHDAVHITASCIVTVCENVNVGVRVGEQVRLNLICPIFGRRKADFTRAAKISIQLIERKKIS